MLHSAPPAATQLWGGGKEHFLKTDAADVTEDYSSWEYTQKAETNQNQIGNHTSWNLLVLRIQKLSMKVKFDKDLAEIIKVTDNWFNFHNNIFIITWILQNWLYSPTQYLYTHSWISIGSECDFIPICPEIDFTPIGLECDNLVWERYTMNINVCNFM